MLRGVILRVMAHPEPYVKQRPAKPPIPVEEANTEALRSFEYVHSRDFASCLWELMLFLSARADWSCATEKTSSTTTISFGLPVRSRAACPLLGSDHRGSHVFHAQTMNSAACTMRKDSGNERARSTTSSSPASTSRRAPRRARARCLCR